MARESFSPAEGTSGGGGPTIPPGTWHFRLAAAEVAPSRAGHPRIELVWRCLEGPGEGVKLSDYVSLWHPKPGVVGIAREKMARLAWAGRIDDITADRVTGDACPELLGKVVRAEVAAKPSITDPEREWMEIVRYFQAEQAAPPAAPAARLEAVPHDSDLPF